MEPPMTEPPAERKTTPTDLPAPPLIPGNESPALEPIRKRRAIKWALLTIFTPLLIGILALTIYISAWFARMAMAGTPHQGPPPPSVLQSGVMLTAGIGLWFTLFLWWFIHRKQASFATLFQTKTQGIWSDVGIGLLLAIVWVVIYGSIGWPSFSNMFVFDENKLISLPASLSAGFCEEFLFRGFVMLMVLRAGGGPKYQVLWSALSFGLAHIMWGPVGMLFTVALGASFGLVTLWKGNVWAAVTAHTFLNLCIEPGLMQKSMSFSQG